MVTGYDILSIENDTGETAVGNYWTSNDPYERYAYENQPNSIIHAILRGVALMAETYYVSWWSIDYDGDYPYLYITVAVAGDLSVDAISHSYRPHQETFTDAIAKSLGDAYQWDEIQVYAQEIVGDNLSYDQPGSPYALKAGAAKTQMTAEAKAKRESVAASPKTETLRNPKSTLTAKKK